MEFAHGQAPFLVGRMTMLMQCLSAVCMLGVVIVGLLVIIRVVSLEELGNGILRASLVAMLAIIGLCVLKGVLLPVLISWLVTLRQVSSRIVIIMFAVIALVLVIRMLIFKLQQWLSTWDNHDKGEL
jgi:hypothetical protein